MIDALYADASALVKLVVDEAETPALQDYLRVDQPPLTTSALTLVEVQRSARVANSGGEGAARARALLDAVELVDLDRDLLEDAVSYSSAHVRSLDAIHLASAVRVGARRMLVYDRRLAEAASAAGLEVLSPGA